MVVCQSSLLPSLSSLIRACSKVGSLNVSDLNLGPYLGFVVNNNAAGMGIMLIFLILSHPSSSFHRVCIDFGNPEPIYLIVNSILIVISIFSASLQHHLFMNLKYFWSSMLLGFHSRKHLQKYAVKLIRNVFLFRVSLAACCFYMS